MTALGLIALNLVFLVSGGLLVWAVRAPASLGELVRLAGVAYMAGVGIVSVLATELLVFGGGLGWASILALAAAVAGASLLAGRRLGRAAPSRARAARGGERAALLGIAGLAVAVVMLEVFLRQARVHPVDAWDGWSFWVPKAEGIYYYHGLDGQLMGSLAGPSYPLLLPALQAMAFSAGGGVHASSLAVQEWLLLLGFLTAVAGLLRPRVPLALIWPFLAMLVAMPSFGKGALSAQADVTLDYFFALGALCLGLWLLDRSPGFLVLATVFLAAAVATKREGTWLTAVLLAGALAGALPRLRWALARLVPVGVVAVLASVPWQIWWTSRGLKSDAPTESLGHILQNVGRLPRSLWIVLRLSFDVRLWLLALPLAFAAAILLLLRARRPLAVMFVTTSVLAGLGFAWVLWAFSFLPLDTSSLTPTPRAVGSIALLAVALAPLMLGELLARASPEEP